MNLSLTGNKAYMEYISRSSNLLIGVIISSPSCVNNSGERGPSQLADSRHKKKQKNILFLFFLGALLGFLESELFSTGSFLMPFGVSVCSPMAVVANVNLYSFPLGPFPLGRLPLLGTAVKLFASRARACQPTCQHVVSNPPPLSPPSLIDMSLWYLGQLPPWKTLQSKGLNHGHQLDETFTIMWSVYRTPLIREVKLMMLARNLQNKTSQSYLQDNNKSNTMMCNGAILFFMNVWCSFFCLSLSTLIHPVLENEPFTLTFCMVVVPIFYSFKCFQILDIVGLTIIVTQVVMVISPYNVLFVYTNLVMDQHGLELNLCHNPCPKRTQVYSIFYSVNPIMNYNPRVWDFFKLWKA